MLEPFTRPIITFNQSYDEVNRLYKSSTENMTTHYFMLYFFPSYFARGLESIYNETLLGLLSPLLSYSDILRILRQGNCTLRLWRNTE